MATNTELQAAIAQLQQQQAMTIQAIHAFAEGRLNDEPDSVTWLLAAISPGLETTPAPFVFDE